MPEEPFMLVSLEEAKAKKLAQVLNNETCTKLLNYLSSHKEATESEIAKKLKLPLSTVHYNLKQLVEARLVLADEYHYSEKGREVNHYKLANKYIIIAPHEDTGGFLDKLKTFLPVTLITVAVAAVLKVLNVINGANMAPENSIQALPRSDAMAKATPAAAPLAAPVAERSAEFAEEAVAGGVADTVAGATAADAGPTLYAMDDAINTTVNETVNHTMVGPNPVFLQNQTDCVQAIAPGIVEGGCVVEPTPFFSNPLILSFLVGGLFAIGVLVLIAYIRHTKKK